MNQYTVLSSFQCTDTSFLWIKVVGKALRSQLIFTLIISSHFFRWLRESHVFLSLRCHLQLIVFFSLSLLFDFSSDSRKMNVVPMKIDGLKKAHRTTHTTDDTYIHKRKIATHRRWHHTAFAWRKHTDTRHQPKRLNWTEIFMSFFGRACRSWGVATSTTCSCSICRFAVCGVILANLNFSSATFENFSDFFVELKLVSVKLISSRLTEQKIVYFCTVWIVFMYTPFGFKR